MDEGLDKLLRFFIGKIKEQADEKYADADAASNYNDLLKDLLEAELFHTSWKSRRPPAEASPPYNGDLFEKLAVEIVREMFDGLTITVRSSQPE